MAVTLSHQRDLIGTQCFGGELALEARSIRLYFGRAENRRKTGQEKGNVTPMLGCGGCKLLRSWLLR